MSVRNSAAIRAALKGYEPTDEQWRAISHPLEPLCLIAGAGSGKTAVMAARVAWALENHPFSPSQILGLTFTTKAAQELLDRVRLALEQIHDDSGEDVSVFTYNAFAAGIVRDHGLLVGVEPEAGLLSDAQRWQLVLSCIDDLPPFEALEIRSAYVVGSALGLAEAVSHHMTNLADIDAAADRILSLKNAEDMVRESAAKRKELVRAVAAYIEAKRQTSRIDFGDQVTKAVEVLEANPEVCSGYRDRYPFVLLDEYQDTNVAQRRLLQALIPPEGAVTAVGDARQAIFAWRGATMYNLIGFPSDFPRRDGALYEPVSLSENFRSGSRILDVANAVVDKIDVSRRPGLPLRSQPENGEGRVASALFSDERAECAWIAEQCERLHDEPTAEGRAPVAWKDIAILVRRKAAMDMLLQELEEKEIPVEVIGLGGLLKTPEVIEVVSWLRALETKPGANRWLGRLLLGPRWRVHYRDLSLLARWAASRNYDFRLKLAEGDEERARDLAPGDVGFALVEALSHVDEIEGLGDETRRRLKAFGAMLGALRKRSNAPLLELVQEILRTAGIWDALESSNARTAGAAKQNISNFLDQVASFAPVEGESPTLRSFINYLDAAEQAEETLEATQPADQDSVKLMTVHSAKGLEFECVFVPSVASRINRQGDAVYSIFPNTRASNPLTSYSELPYEVREDAEHLPRFEGNLGKFQKAVKERVVEDERRLFYVALTRAKQRLAVTASWWYGRDKQAKGPSPFWTEVADLTERGLVDVVRKDEEPAENPMFGAMEHRRLWPPVARAGIDDALFPDGFGSTSDAVVGGDVPVDQLLSALSASDRAEAESLIADHARDLDVIAAAAKPAAPPSPKVPDIISATSFVALENENLSAWDLARPLPQRPTPARRIGTEVHRLIEELSRARAEGLEEPPAEAAAFSAFPDETELDEPGETIEPGRIDKMLEAFEKSYGARTIARLPSGEPMVELPFTLRRGDQIVRGRIDAVYETDNGGLEIVDFKTGKRFESAPDKADQLELYKQALQANGVAADRDVQVTYAFLSV